MLRDRLLRISSRFPDAVAKLNEADGQMIFAAMSTYSCLDPM
jgi:hypothetical protein